MFQPGNLSLDLDKLDTLANEGHDESSETATELFEDKDP